MFPCYVWFWNVSQWGTVNNHFSWKLNSFVLHHSTQCPMYAPMNQANDLGAELQFPDFGRPLAINLFAVTNCESRHVFPILSLLPSQRSYLCNRDGSSASRPKRTPNGVSWWLYRFVLDEIHKIHIFCVYMYQVYQQYRIT